MKMAVIKIMVVMATMMIGVVVGDIVDVTCKKTSDNALCLSLLRSDPHSSSANTAGLALILVDKIKALGLQTLGEINKAYKTKPTLKRALDGCIQDCKTILDDVNNAVTAIKGNPKFAGGPIADAGLSAIDCEKRFPKGQSPVTGLTYRLQKICDVAGDIADMY